MQVSNMIRKGHTQYVRSLPIIIKLDMIHILIA